MRTIYKYELNVTDLQQVTMPERAIIRKVGIQRGKVCLWAEVETENEPCPRTFEIIGTGNPMEGPSDKRQYIDSVQMMMGTEFVWHIYERI